MEDQEKWGLSREEIEARLRRQNQEKDTKGPPVAVALLDRV